MTRRGITAITAAAAAAALTACSSSTAGTPTSTGSGPGSGSSSAGATSTGSAPVGHASASSSPTTGASAATTPEGLTSTLREGLSSTHSAHITLRITTQGQNITGSGDETIVAGKVSALDLTETIPGAGDLRLIQVGGKTYAKLPASLSKSSKPYALVTPNSSDPTIKSLAMSLQSSQSSSAVDSAGVLAGAAKSITDRGPATVNGTRTTQYYLVVDVAKLPTTYSGRSTLIQAGITTLPINLYVDSAGRPVEITESLTVSGKSVSTVVGVTRYNQPVRIVAPPAAQVSSS